MVKKSISRVLATILCSSILFSFNVQAESKFEAVGEQKSIPGTIRSIEEYSSEFLSVSGHALADGNIHDRSEYYNTKYHRVCSTEEEFLQAICDSSKGEVKIIEVIDDMNLGWKEISESAQNMSCIEAYKSSLISEGIPVSSPSLMTSGVSTITLSDIKGLTIFSPNGSCIRHTELKLQDTSEDIVIRNLEFDEMYEWDDTQKGGFGGNGNRKRTGWTYIKVNGAHDVWIDHCSFGFAFDGNVDIENASQGVTISWCQFGKIDYSKEGSLYKTISYMEDLYQNDKEHAFITYSACRDAGMTPFQMMQFMAYHKKVHMIAWDDNSQLPSHVSFMYNHYENCGSRMPLCGGANAEMINCYFDNRDFYTVLNYIRENNIDEIIEDAIGMFDYPLYALNVREDGALAADTCVFQNVESPITDYNYFRYAYGEVNSPDEFLDDGEAIIVNSEYSFTEYSPIFDSLNNSYKELETIKYRGGTYDNNGENKFAIDYTFSAGMYMDFKWIINDGVLPFEYKVVPLDDVREIMSAYSGAGNISMNSVDWLKTKYDKSFETKFVSKDASAEAISINISEASIAAGSIIQIDAKVYPNNTYETGFTWESSNESVATVNDAGTVKGLTEGETIITVEQEDSKLSARVKINVYIAPEKLTLDKNKATIYMDDTVSLKYTLMPENTSNKAVKWISSDENVVKVDEDGRLIPVSEGKATVKVIFEMNSDIFAKCIVTVKSGKNPANTIEPQLFKTGDLDGDEIVSAKDALIVLKSVAKLYTISDGQKQAADVNKDGIIDASDALDILKVAAKLKEFDE